MMLIKKRMPFSFSSPIVFEDDADHWVGLRNTHGLAALVHGLQAAYGFYLTNTRFKDQGYYTVTNRIRYGTNGEAESDDVVGTYRLGNLVSTFPALSMMNHLWSYFCTESYETYVNRGYNPVRWGEYSISAGLMFVVIAQMSGITDIKLLTTMGLANAGLQAIGYTIEHDVGDQNYESAMRQQIPGFLIFAALWSALFTSFFTSLSKASSDVPDMVYAIIFVLFGLMLVFGVLSIQHIRKVQSGDWSFSKVERYYLYLSFISKSLLTNMTLFGVLGRDTPDVEEESK
jgi:hypothetical protein